MQKKKMQKKKTIYLNHQCRVRLGEISSHLNCHVLILLLRSCAFCCRTPGFHQEASRCIPFSKLERCHRGKKQGHQIIMSPVINYRQLHFRLFALEKDMKPNRYCKSVSIHHLNTRSHLKYTDFERFEILSTRFCASRTAKKTSM